MKRGLTVLIMCALTLFLHVGCGCRERFDVAGAIVDTNGLPVKGVNLSIRKLSKFDSMTDGRYEFEYLTVNGAFHARWHGCNLLLHFSKPDYESTDLIFYTNTVVTNLVVILKPKAPDWRLNYRNFPLRRLGAEYELHCGRKVSYGPETSVSVTLVSSNALSRAEALRRIEDCLIRHGAIIH
jgi:hypothetical protein